MTTQSTLLAGLRAPLLAAAALLALGAQAAPVSINTPFMNLENRIYNSLGFTQEQFLRIGANAVTPNGSAGTTGIGRTTDLITGLPVSRTINFNPGPIIPDFFSRSMADAPGLRGAWTLTFTNGSDSASRVVDIADTAQQAPFVNSITLSGTSANPTFSWTPPPGATVNGYRINIHDKSLIVPGVNNGQVASRNLLPSVTSHTVTAADFTVPGYAFALGTNYSIEISLMQTKDGSSTNLGNANLQAIARTYADFTPNSGGGPPVNLPVVLANGSFLFNMSVVAGQTYFIDPEVAIGYDYEIGAGNPFFASVDLPELIGDGFFDIYGFDGSGNQMLLAANWDGRDVYNFAPGGVSRFRVLGIETSANLDPSNTTAFITGLTFAGSGQFTGTQTPITVTIDVPEPPTLALAGLALLGMAWRRRHQA